MFELLPEYSTTIDIEGHHIVIRQPCADGDSQDEIRLTLSQLQAIMSRLPEIEARMDSRAP